MIKKLPILLLLLVAGAWFLLTTSRLAKAQGLDTSLPPDDVGGDQSITFTAIPPRTANLKAKPGETIQTKIKLRNVSEKPQTVSTEAVDYIIGEDGKTPTPITAEEAAPLRWRLASWMTVSPTSTTIGPNQVAEFDLVIQVPQDALPGGHYALVLHTPGTASGGKKDVGRTANSASVVSQKVGTLVYVTVAGDVHEEAYVRRFSAPQWVEFGPVAMQYAIENLSDTHITPQASIVVKNLFGMTVDTIAIEPLNIFPYSTREFSATLDKVWGFGPYRALLSVPYGESGKIASASLMFWMIPYKLILAALVIFATLLAVFIVIRRHILHRSDIRTQQIEVLEERIRELEKGRD